MALSWQQTADAVVLGMLPVGWGSPGVSLERDLALEIHEQMFRTLKWFAPMQLWCSSYSKPMVRTQKIFSQQSSPPAKVNRRPPLRSQKHKSCCDFRSQASCLLNAPGGATPGVPRARPQAPGARQPRGPTGG